MMKMEKFKIKNIAVYEHLDYHLKHTTYGDRFQWLKESNAFVRSIQKIKLTKPK